MSGGHSKTGWLGAPGTQRPCSAMSCVCQYRGAWVLGCTICMGCVGAACGVVLWVHGGLEHSVVPRALPGSCRRCRIARANCKLARLVLNALAASFSPPVPPCPPENQQLCQQRGDCAWPAASKAARTGQVLAGAAGAPRWEQAGPGCQGCRINKAAHRLARREGGRKQAGGRTGVSGAPQTQRTSCLLLPGPREQPPLRPVSGSV